MPITHHGNSMNATDTRRMVCFHGASSIVVSILTVYPCTNHWTSHEYLFKNRHRTDNGIGNESVSLGLDKLLLEEETDSNSPSQHASTINTQIVLTIKDGYNNDR